MRKTLLQTYNIQYADNIMLYAANEFFNKICSDLEKCPIDKSEDI